MQVKVGRESIAHDPPALADAEGLLERYPDLRPEERDRVGRFLRNGAPIDIGFLSSDADLWRKAEAFRRENPKYFSTGRRVYAAWAAALMAIALALFLLKDMGLN